MLIIAVYSQNHQNHRQPLLFALCHLYQIIHLQFHYTYNTLTVILHCGS